MTYETAAGRILAVLTDEEITQGHVCVLARLTSMVASRTLAQLVDEGRVGFRERRDGTQGRPAYLYRRVAP